MATYLNFNGKIISSGKSVITADNRSFRYGDGLFETIRVSAGRILLAAYHFDRLFAGIRLLRFDPPAFFTPDKLASEILALCAKNGHAGSARVRLVVFRGDGGLYDPQNHFPHYIIQTWETPALGLRGGSGAAASIAAGDPGIQPNRPGNHEDDQGRHGTDREMPLGGQRVLPNGQGGGFNENGLVLDVFPDGRKSCDIFSNLKSNNFLVYAMAALYAREHSLNDSLVLNSYGRIADSTIANVFYISQGVLYTPPLSEGCVAGVMRRFVLENSSACGLPAREQETSIEALESAEELFLTNSIAGIRWVKTFRNTVYTHSRTLSLYRFLLENSVL